LSAEGANAHANIDPAAELAPIARIRAPAGLLVSAWQAFGSQTARVVRCQSWWKKP